MTTARETILSALHTRLSTLPATVLRGDALPERVPREGLLILRDGDPGEPEVTLSQLAYHYQHNAEIEAVVRSARNNDRDAAFDALVAEIGAALAAERTLGGLCDWVEPQGAGAGRSASGGSGQPEGGGDPRHAALHDQRSARLSPTHYI